MIGIEPEKVGIIPGRLAHVTAVLENAVAQGRIAGSVFGIMRHGKLAFLKSVGYRDGSMTGRLETDAIFPLASMTKPLVSMAAMMLVEQGRIFLSDPLESILPAFASTGVLTLYGSEPVGRPITLLDLFRHTAGFTSGSLYPSSLLGKLYFDTGVHDPNQTLAVCIERLATLPLLHQPGTVWDYSIATDVLARVVEVVSGQSLAAYIREQITEPLRMNDTNFVVPEKDWGRIAEPRIDTLTGKHPPKQDGRLLCSRIGGNSGLVGTAYDYLRFCQMILNRGSLQGSRLLGGGTVSQMGADHLSAIPHNSPLGTHLIGPGRGFGLGFAVRLGVGEYSRPGSTGDLDWTGAFGTAFVIDPKLNMAAVMMVNQHNQSEWCKN